MRSLLPAAPQGNRLGPLFLGPAPGPLPHLHAEVLRSLHTGRGWAAPRRGVASQSTSASSGPGAAGPPSRGVALLPHLSNVTCEPLCRNPADAGRVREALRRSISKSLPPCVFEPSKLQLTSVVDSQLHHLATKFLSAPGRGIAQPLVSLLSCDASAVRGPESAAH